MDKHLYEILDNYELAGTVKEIIPYGDGHINHTYKVCADREYLLQQINDSVFRHPDELMANYVAVTDYLKKIIVKNGGNPERETLTVVFTKDNKSFCKTKDGRYYRLLLFIDAVSINFAEDTQTLYKVASAFGKFQKDLAGYDASTLYEVIPKFHNTVRYYNDLISAIDINKAERKSEVLKEIEYAKSMRDRISVIVDGIDAGEIPLRVAHNDTKLNNVLLDRDTLECVCVIDLDTVMPGSYLYDFGDALRFAGSSAAEDEKDLSKIYFDMDKFSAFTNGYLSEVKAVLTESEIKLLPFSVELMTYECGIRFLADYLRGDTYFKIGYEKHNLDRARAQFKLAQDIDTKLSEMEKIVEQYLK